MSTVFSTSAIILQCLLLVERCTSQAPPLPTSGVRLFSQSREIKNHSIISGADIGFNLNQGLFCQSANSAANAEWFGPPQLNNPVSEGRALITISAPGQSGLVKNGSIALAPSDDGLYQCLITDEQGRRHTLVVGIYNSIRYLLNTGPKLVSPVEYNLVSAVDSNVLVFRLSFLIADSPATTFTCSRNGVQLHQSVQPALFREILNTERTITRITLEIITGDGVYNCTISNDRVLMANNPTAFPAVIVTEIFATERPFNVTVNQTSLNSILILWSAPAEPISQYEVFVNQMSENIQVTQATTTEVAVHGLRTGETYFIYIVAISARFNSLPSQRTNNTTITLDRHFNFSNATTATPEKTVESSVVNSPEFIAVTAVCGGLLLICIAINAAVIGFAIQTWRKAKRVVDTKNVKVDLTECLAYGRNVQPPLDQIRPMYHHEQQTASSTGRAFDQETDIDSNYTLIEAVNTDETYEQML